MRVLDVLENGGFRMDRPFYRDAVLDERLHQFPSEVCAEMVRYFVRNADFEGSAELRVNAVLPGFDS